MNRFIFQLLATLGTVGITYALSKEAEKNIQSIRDITESISNRNSKNHKKGTESSVKCQYPKDIDILQETSKYADLYVNSLKYKNYNDFIQCITEELVPNVEEVRNNPFVSEYFYYLNLKKVIGSVLDIDKDKKLQFDKLKSIKVLKAYIFKDWLKDNFYEFVDLSSRILTIKGSLKDIAITQCIISYGDIQQVATIFFKYSPEYMSWQIYKLYKGTLSKFLKFLQDTTINFYSYNCKIFFEKNVLSNIDDNNVFSKHLVDGIVTSNKSKESITGINISMDRLYTVYDKIWYEINLIMEAIHRKPCAWFVQYDEGIPIGIYMAHDEKSEYVGGYNVETGYSFKYKTDGGIWSLLD